MKLLKTTILLCVALVMCVHAPFAQDSAKPGKPDETAAALREFSADEIDAAHDALERLSVEQRMLINHLRYLLRPKYEDELMAGREFRPCVLLPLELPESGPLEQNAMLRLWAVLASGVPLTDSIRSEVARLRLTPMPEPADSLAGFGLQMMLCTLALRRDIGDADKLRDRGEDLLKAAMKHQGTDADSPLIVGSVIDPIWFGNQVWRALVSRCAVELELKFNERAWETGLRNLNGSGHRRRGWTSKFDTNGPACLDLDTNLFAIAAFSLATSSPDGVLSKAMLRSLAKQLELVPEVLSRLQKDRIEEPLTGTRLAMIRSFKPELAPESEQGEDWQELILQLAISEQDASGACPGAPSIANEFGLTSNRYSRSGRLVSETVMSCIALSGGLLAAGKGPLDGMSMGEVGRAMYALSVLHASALPEGESLSDEVSPEIASAIERGCEFLEEIQNPDGSFPGQHAGYFGNSAVAMLAMMHGGYGRDSDPIRRGMDWLDSDRARDAAEKSAAWGFRGNMTYSDALVLMMFQKYYEPEQQESGILCADTPAEFEAAAGKVRAALSKRHRDIIDAIVKRLNDAYVSGGNGAWGYGNPDANSHRDNSNSQFAMLGYKSASLLGAKLDLTKIEHEAQRLVRTYSKDSNLSAVEYCREEEGTGRTRASTWKARIQPGGWGYDTGPDAPCTGMTAASISSLAIAHDELKVRGKLDKALGRKIGLTIHGAQYWLASNYVTVDESNGSLKRVKPFVWSGIYDQWDGIGLYYDLYSVERACVLSGITTMGRDVDWYAIVAEGLVNTQRAQGDWTQSTAETDEDDKRVIQTINTSWAILILKKGCLPIVAEPKLREPRQQPRNPITNGPKDKPDDNPKGPVTGGSKDDK